MDGSDLNSLSTPVSMRIARTGFVYKDRIAIGEIQDLVHVHDTNGDHKIEIAGSFIYRVSYRADEPDKILISGDWIGEDQDPFTLEYNLVDDSQHYIECDGEGAYKCTIYGDEILYAEKIGKHFEHRRIKQGKTKNGSEGIPNARSIPCQMAHRHRNEVAESLLQVTKKCGCRRNKKDEANENPSRPSCIECVEKHVAAAFVIASEIHDGYSYRLRLIGHLHEAEDESQEFTQLHNIIRQSRKEYQQQNKIPDWETIASCLNKCNNVPT
jgi:hypothetical protein